MANALGNIGSAVLGGLKGGAEALAAHSPGYNQFKQNQARDMAIETQKMERWIKIAKDPSFTRDLRINSLKQAFSTKAGKVLLGQTTIRPDDKWYGENIDRMDKQGLIPEGLLAGGPGDRTSISWKNPLTGATMRRSGGGKERQYQTVWFDKSGKKKSRLVPESQYTDFQAQIEASGGTLNEPDSLEDQYRFWQEALRRARGTDTSTTQSRILAQATGQDLSITRDVEGEELAMKKLAALRKKLGFVEADDSEPGKRGPTPIRRPPKRDDFFSGEFNKPTGGDIIGGLEGTPAQKKAIDAIVGKRLGATEKQDLINKILNNERIRVKDNAGNEYTLPAEQVADWLAIAGNTLAAEDRRK